MAEERYVVHGAWLRCSRGSHLVPLTILIDRRIKVGNQFIANKSDVFRANVCYFGTCESRKSACVRTGNRPNVSTENIIPTSLTPWIDCKENVLIAGHPAVLESSYMLCTVGGGIITVRSSGQS